MVKRLAEKDRIVVRFDSFSGFRSFFEVPGIECDRHGREDELYSLVELKSFRAGVYGSRYGPYACYGCLQGSLVARW